MLAFVRAMRGRPEECESSIEPVLFIIFIHSLIVRFENTPPKSRWIFAGPSPFSYLIFTAFLQVFTFHFFSNIPKTVNNLNHLCSCGKYQAPSFDNKQYLNQKDNRGEK